MSSRSFAVNSRPSSFAARAIDSSGTAGGFFSAAWANAVPIEPVMAAPAAPARAHQTRKLRRSEANWRLIVMDGPFEIVGDAVSGSNARRSGQGSDISARLLGRGW